MASPKRKFRAIMQEDGDFVIYYNDGARNILTNEQFFECFIFSTKSDQFSVIRRVDITD
jgi:hypothetical protein